jgi:hypothetical protein
MRVTLAVSRTTISVLVSLSSIVGGTAARGRSYKRSAWSLVSFGYIVWKLALNPEYNWVIRFVRWFAVFFFLWYYIPWWELTSSLRLRDSDVFTRWRRQPHAQPSNWRTRLSLSVGVITFDLSDIGSPTSSYGTFDIVLMISRPRKPNRYVKLGMTSVWLISSISDKKQWTFLGQNLEVSNTQNYS